MVIDERRITWMIIREGDFRVRSYLEISKIRFESVCYIFRCGDHWTVFAMEHRLSWEIIEYYLLVYLRRRLRSPYSRCSSYVCRFRTSFLITRFQEFFTYMVWSLSREILKQPYNYECSLLCGVWGTREKPGHSQSKIVLLQFEKGKVRPNASMHSSYLRCGHWQK